MNLEKFKKVIFWLQAGIALFLLSVGLLTTLLLFLDGTEIDSFVIVYFEFAWSNMITEFRELRRGSPEVWLAAIFVAIYVVSIRFFAQTEREKKLFKYIVGASVLGLFLSAVSITLIALSGLTM